MCACVRACMCACFKLVKWKKALYQKVTIRLEENADRQQYLRDSTNVHRNGKETSSLLKSCLGLFESLHGFSDMV